MNNSAPHVFISYASVDRPRALRFADRLTAAGIPIWIDRRNIAGGSSWNAAIVRAIRGCGALVIFATRAAVHSRNVQRELLLALQYDKPMLPILAEPVEFPDEVQYALAGVQWIEVEPGPIDGWLPRVIDALTRLGI